MSASAAVIVLAMAGYWALSSGEARGAASSTGRDRVAVFPFAPAEDNPLLTEVGDRLQQMLVSRLDGEGVPSAVSARRRRTRPATDPGQHLGGWISGTPERVTIVASMTIPGSPASAVQARAAGSIDSLPELADRLTVELVARRAARDSAELVALRAASLPVLRAYLLGQEYWRRGRTPEATAQLQRALFLDSTFAPAAIGLAIIGDIMGPVHFQERWKLESAWRLAPGASEADRSLLEAHLGLESATGTPLIRRIAAALRATTIAPNRWESWYAAAVNLDRFGALVDYPGWMAAADSALARALALDSTNAGTLDMLIQHAAASRDRHGVRRYTDRFLAHNGAGVSAGFFQWRTAVAFDDSAQLSALRARFGEMPSMSLGRILMWSQEHAIGVDDADRAAEVLLRRATDLRQRRLATNRVVPLLMNRGRPRQALRLLSALDVGFGAPQGLDPLTFPVFAALYWDGDSSEAAAAARALETALADGSVPPQTTAEAAGCALSHWRIATGEPDTAAVALRRARTDYRASTSGPHSGIPICLAAAEARLLRSRGSAERRDALYRLDSLLLATTNARDMMVTIGNLAAARLYEEEGDLNRALRVVRRRGFWNPFLSTQLREEGRLAARAGDRAAAVRAYEHYLLLRDRPEPQLEPERDGVRAELRELEAEDRSSRPFSEWEQAAESPITLRCESSFQLSSSLSSSSSTRIET